jgi:hypothetical protein
MQSCRRRLANPPVPCPGTIGHADIFLPLGHAGMAPWVSLPVLRAHVALTWAF